MGPVLPFEIWEHIVSFLPEAFIGTLYPVNPPLLQIALDSKYEVAVVDSSAKRQYQITPRNSNAHGRVRKVILQDSCNPRTCAASGCYHEVPLRVISYINTGTQQQPGRLRTLLTNLRLLRRPTLPTVTAPITVGRFYKEATEVVLGMTGVREISVCLVVVTGKEYIQKLEITKQLLRSSFNDLRTLYLDCALEYIRHILFVDLKIPQLSTLRLSFRTLFASTRPEESTPFLKFFFINHSRSITHLELYFAHTVSPSDFLRDTPCFPLLSKLLLAFPVLDPDKQRLQGLRDFVYQHRNQLSNLSLYVKSNPFHHLRDAIPVPTTFDIGASSTLFHCPKLTDLMLSMSPMWFSGIVNREYVRRYQSTLESLQLQTCVLSFTDMQELFSPTTFPCLRRVSMTVGCLSPHHLSLLAGALPTLKHLHIKYTQHVTSDTHIDALQPAKIYPPFARDIPLVIDTLSSWGLESIVLISDPQIRYISIQDRKALVSALPCVRLFSEVDPDEYAISLFDPGEILRRRGDCWGDQSSPDFFPA